MIRAAKQCTPKIYSGCVVSVKPLGNLTRATTITYEESPSREVDVGFDEALTNGFPCPLA
jgi:hypothetical protein